MKKVDFICLLFSLLINILVLLAFPNLIKIETQGQRIRVGLVATEAKQRPKAPAIPKKEEVKKEKKKEQEKPKTKEEVKKEEIKVKEEVKKIEEKAIEKEVVKEEVKKVEKVEEVKKPNIDDLKSLIVKDQDLNKDQDFIADLDIDNIVNDFNDNINNSKDELIIFDMSEKRDDSSIPDGYRHGTEKHKSTIMWDNSNKEPIFPESAKRKGKNGHVILRIKVNKRGDIVSLVLEEGSGVPEINEAILRVAGTWKMRMSVAGLSDNGEFLLKYNFILGD